MFNVGSLPLPPYKKRLARNREAFQDAKIRSTPTGIRTPVPWLRTMYPRPLDDGGKRVVGNESTNNKTSLPRGSNLGKRLAR